MLDKKLRPTFTITQMDLLAKGIDSMLRDAIKSETLNTTYLSSLVVMKDYINDFMIKQGVKNARLDLLANHVTYSNQQLATNNAGDTGEITLQSAATSFTQSMVDEANGTSEYKSPLDNPNLSRAQKATILSVKAAELLTPEETKFTLDYKFEEMMASMGKGKVSESDL